MIRTHSYIYTERYSDVELHISAALFYQLNNIVNKYEAFLSY